VLALGTTNQSTEFEVYISADYEDMKGDTQNVENGVIVVVRGHLRSVEIASFDTAHTSPY